MALSTSVPFFPANKHSDECYAICLAKFISLNFNVHQYFKCTCKRCSEKPSENILSLPDCTCQCASIIPCDEKKGYFHERKKTKTFKQTKLTTRAESDCQEKAQSAFHTTGLPTSKGFLLVERKEKKVEKWVEKNLRTQLYEACSKNNIEKVERLLKKKVDLNIPSPLGEYPLLEAVKKNHAEIVLSLLIRGANPNVTEKNQNALTMLCHNIQDEERALVIMECLFANRAVIQKDATPLVDLCSVNCHNKGRIRLNLIKLFVTQMLKVEEKTAGMRLSKALIRAANNDQTVVVRLLLEYNANPNYLGKEYGWSKKTTALHCAVRAGNLNTVKLLLKHNSKVNILDEEGNTALNYACMKGHDEIAILLLEKGADPILGQGGKENFAYLFFFVKFRACQVLMEKGFPPQKMLSGGYFSPLGQKIRLYDVFNQDIGMLHLLTKYNFVPTGDAFSVLEKTIIQDAFYRVTGEPLVPNPSPEKE